VSQRGVNQHLLYLSYAHNEACKRAYGGAGRYIASNLHNGVLKAISAKENLTVVFIPAKQLVITAYRTKKPRSKP
jgi:hypothetical protein